MVELFLTDEEAEALRQLLEAALADLDGEPAADGAARRAGALPPRAFVEGVLRRLDIALPLRPHGR